MQNARPLAAETSVMLLRVLPDLPTQNVDVPRPGEPRKNTSMYCLRKGVILHHFREREMLGRERSRK